MKKWKRVTYLLTGSFAVNILKYDFVFLDNVLKLFLLFYDYMQVTFMCEGVSRATEATIREIDDAKPRQSHAAIGGKTQ